MRAADADDPQGREDGVALVAARAVQPRGAEARAEVDARAGRGGSAGRDQAGQLADGPRDVRAGRARGAERDGCARRRVRLVEQPHGPGRPGDPGVPPGRHHTA